MYEDFYEFIKRDQERRKQNPVKKEPFWIEILPEGWNDMTSKERDDWVMSLDEETRIRWCTSYRLNGPIGDAAKAKDQ